MSSLRPEPGPAERIVGLYEDNAAAWDCQRGRNLFERSWMDRFLALLPKSPRILDVGCGMGEPIARYFIEQGANVTGIDSSPSLIELARERFPHQQWIIGDMRALALNRHFNGVIAWHSFFHLSPDDQRRTLPRFAAHLEPGGALMFTSGPQRGEDIGEWQSEPLYHSSLDPDEYRALLEANGLVVREQISRDPECGHATVWLAQMRPASGLDGSA